MKFRTHPWVDLDTEETKYGIQCQEVKGGRYKHCHELGKPMLFDREEEAIEAIALLEMRFDGELEECPTTDKILPTTRPKSDHLRLVPV